MEEKMALCTDSEVKTFLGIKDTQKDDIIALLIPAAQNAIEEYCGAVFDTVEEGGTVTEYHNGDTNRVLLKRYPLDSSVAPIVYEDADREFDAEDLVDSDDYYVDYDTGIIYFDFEAMKGWGAIKVTYTPKYPASGAVSNIPSALKLACIKLVAWEMKRGVDVGVTSRGMPGGTSVSFTADGIPKEIKDVLDLFKP